MDFLIVPTIGFRLLFVLVILRHERRRLISLSVTEHPTADWIARQLTDVFPWDEAPDYMIRDRDGCYGQAVTRRLAAVGIRNHPIAPRSPWHERICPWGRIRRAISRSSASACSPLSRSSADCTMNTAGRSFRQGQPFVPRTVRNRDPAFGRVQSCSVRQAVGRCNIVPSWRPRCSPH